MIQKEIEETFYLKQKLPEAISHICTYLDTYGYEISGCFELSTIGMEEMVDMFKKTPRATDELMPFGRGACGDVYSIWLTNGLSPEEAPIVMFGSEGTLTVLAKNAKEFSQLLSIGYSELGLEDHSLEGTKYKEAKKFRNYMENIYHYTVPKTGEHIISDANKSFPMFESWVEENAW